MEYKKIAYANLVGAAVLLALSGCATQQVAEPLTTTCPVRTVPPPETCMQDGCELHVTLRPGNAPPKLGDRQTSLKLRPGEDATMRFTLTREPGSGTGRVYLVFEEPAFSVERIIDGQRVDVPLYVIHLPQTFNQRLKTMPSPSCSPPCGCKYTIVNVGQTTQQPLDPWIILH